MHWLLSLHGVGMQTPRPVSQLQPMPHWSSRWHDQVGTQVPLRASQKPPAQSVSLVHAEAGEVAGTQVERESQTKPVAQRASESQ